MNAGYDSDGSTGTRYDEGEHGNTYGSEFETDDDEETDLSEIVGAFSQFSLFQEQEQEQEEQQHRP